MSSQAFLQSVAAKSNSKQVNKPKSKSKLTLELNCDAELEHRLKLHEAIATSDMMRDAVKLVKKVKALREQVQEFLDEHSDTGLVIALKDAGFQDSDFDTDYFIELAVHINQDVEMLRYNVMAAECFLDSQVLERTEAEPLPRRSR